MRSAMATCLLNPLLAAGRIKFVDSPLFGGSPRKKLSLAAAAEILGEFRYGTAEILGEFRYGTGRQDAKCLRFAVCMAATN